jgi:hypothetical protein
MYTQEDEKSFIDRRKLKRIQREMTRTMNVTLSNEESIEGKDV